MLTLQFLLHNVFIQTELQTLTFLIFLNDNSETVEVMDDKKVVHEEDNENPEKKALVPETDKEKEDTE